MDIYHGWFNLKPDVKDVEFAAHFKRYMDRLMEEELISSWRLTRRKLGLGPAHLPEFHMWVETDGLAQLDEAFKVISGRSGDHEKFHHAVNSRVTDLFFALYRDFPDPNRVIGEELF